MKQLAELEGLYIGFLIGVLIIIPLAILLYEITDPMKPKNRRFK